MQLEVCYSRRLSERIDLTHRGPQAPLFAAPPLAARVRRSLHRGGQGLWTLWTDSIRVRRTVEMISDTRHKGDGVVTV